MSGRLMALTILVMLVVAAPGAGQSCVGRPMPAASAGFGAAAAFTEGSKTFGMGMGANLGAPVFFSGQISLTDIDDYAKNWANVGGSVGLRVSSGAVTICPVMSVEYSWLKDEGVLAEVPSMSMGGGIGYDVDLAPGFTFSPSVMGNIGFARSVYSDGYNEVSEDYNAFWFSGAAAFRLSRMYITSYVSVSTTEGSNPTFGVMTGFVVPVL